MDSPRLAMCPAECFCPLSLSASAPSGPNYFLIRFHSPLSPPQVQKRARLGQEAPLEVAPGLGARAGTSEPLRHPPPDEDIWRRGTSGQGGGVVLDRAPKWLFLFQTSLGSIKLGILKNALDGLSLTVSSCLDPFQIKWPQGGWRGGKLAGL